MSTRKPPQAAQDALLMEGIAAHIATLPPPPMLQTLLGGGFKPGQQAMMLAGMRSGKSMMTSNLLLEVIRREAEAARVLAEKVKQLDEALPQVCDAPPRIRL